MAGWPEITAVVVTWNRPQMVRATIKALQQCLRYDGVLRWHLADDKSEDGYVASIVAEFEQLQISHSVTPRLGWGANVNAALAHIKTPYIFLCEDDYIALRPLNLNQGVALIETVPDIGAVRYDGIAAHALNLELRETRSEPTGAFSYMRILKASPFLNVYSNRPHLAHRRFHEYYGKYPEGLSLAMTEDTFAKKVYNDRGGGPNVAVLADGVVTAFDHIGQSRQGSAADKEVMRG